MMDKLVNFSDFEDIFKELGNKKISDLSLKEISKYLLVSEELNWMDSNVGDDKIFYKFNESLLDDLSYSLEVKIFEDINQDILYKYDLHKEPELDELDL